SWAPLSRARRDAATRSGPTRPGADNQGTSRPSRAHTSGTAAWLSGRVTATHRSRALPPAPPTNQRHSRLPQCPAHDRLAGREATDPMAVSSTTDARRTDHPHYASVVAGLRPGDRAMPAHVIVPDVVYNGPAKSPGQLAGYLGAAYDPFV